MTQATADNKKDLMRFLIEQVKAGSLPKDKAVEFLKVVDGSKPDDATAEDIAIVGMACRFPEADNKEQFWHNLAQGKNSIRPFPEKRKNQLAAIEDDDIELFNGGFLNSVEEFDNDYFNIPPAIAKHMDPYHRLFLQTLIETIEDAGYSRADLQGKNVGIYAGNDHTHRLFSNYLSFIDDKDFNSITGSWTAVFASRLAYLLNLQGPALVIDTSCSSGLVAMDYAIKGLQAGDCESALVGAANLFFAPGKGIVGDVENDDFLVRTFDDKAAGTVWGEGVASFLLKTVAQAEKDGDAIYGIIKGIAVNNDGASNGITAPNARAQQDVLLKAWEKAGISPEEISYIESHGTGTNLGDPIEIRGLSNAVAKHTQRKQFCGIGSVKTNIGHTVATAGLASLSKVLLSLKHQQLPPSLNFNQPNNFIDFANSPVYVNDTLNPWPVSEKTRYAGISSFSLSGTNCHLVLQEPPVASANAAVNADAALATNTGTTKAAVTQSTALAQNPVFTQPHPAQILAISARSEALLKQTAQRYLDFILAEQPDLTHLCFTAAQGREHHDIRVALVVKTLEEAVQALGQITSDTFSSEAYALEQARQVALSGSKLDKHAKSLTDAFSADSANDERVQKLTDIAQSYLQGARIHWLALFTESQRKRVHLPAQPFKTDSFWITPKKRAVKAVSAQTQSHDIEQIDETAEIIALIQHAPVRIQGADDLEESVGKDAREEGTLEEANLNEQEQTNESVQTKESINSTQILAAKFVAYVIAETLGYDDLTTQSDYYALGGDSITSTKITQILSDLLPIEVQANELLSAANLGAFIDAVVNLIMATPEAVEALETRAENQPNALTSLQNTSASSQSTGVSSQNTDSSNQSAGASNQHGRASMSPLPKQENYPLSRAQQRMYVLADLAPTSTAYNVNAVVEIDELPELAQTEALFNQLIERHESLRTGFVMDGESPVQVIAPACKINVVHTRLADDAKTRTESDTATDNAVKQWAADFIQPFDLSAPPLMRLGFASSANNQRHFMILDMHHIITDGTSMGLLIAEYLQLMMGQTLAPLTLQYKDFAHWHNQQIDALENKHQAYWQARFNEEVPEAQLPLDHPRPAVQQFAGKKVQSLLSHELLAQCKAFAAQQGVSLFMLLSGVFRVLMAKYQVADDLVLGTPVAGRQRREWQSMMGMFVNTVALRFKLDQHHSFSDMLAQLKQQTLADFAHQDYPFELLPDQLNIPRNTAKNPLFDLYFVLQNEDMGLDGDGVNMLPIDTGIARFDLTVVCRELKNQAAEHGMSIDWEYATSLFNAHTIERMATHFEQVLNQLLAQPDAALSQVSCLTQTEYQQLVVEFNQTETDYPAHEAVQALFEKQVEKSPEAIAFRFVEAGHHIAVELTYQQLNQAANQLAHKLIEDGVKADQIVALYLPRSVDMAIAILAVLKAGATYVPIDSANPEERNQGILEDSGAVMMLTHTSMPALSAPIPTLNVDALDITQQPKQNPPTQNHGDSLIYLMYTSGTTGKPKGTQIRHKSVTRVVCDTNYMTLSPNDVCLQISSFAFDGCVADFYGALLNGAHVILTSKEDTLEPQILAEVIANHQVTSMFVTTALFNIIADNMLEALGSIKTIMFGGEAVSVQHVLKAYNKLGPGKLIHVYGPTESTVFATGYVINSLPDSPATVPIGPAIANTRVYVLDDFLKPVPAGISGELFIGGDGIALGYLNREDLTAERFIASPFVDGDRLYRTGDVVTCQEDGSIVYQSRKDHQVKIRGFRIELDEVKAILNQHDDIIDSLVTADPDESGTRQLLSWVRVNAPEAFDSPALLNHLRSTLPDYMIPAAITPVAEFPLNNNGKLDKSKLPAPVLSSGEKVDARDDIEQTMLTVWQDILQNHDIGVTDNFFAIGGDSIKGIQVVARLQEHGINLDTATLFQHQNIEALAKHTAQSSANTAEVLQIPCEGALTLNPIQHWFVDSVQRQQLPAASFNHFNQAMQLSLDTPVTKALLEKALQRLTDHHDMLRVALNPASAALATAQFNPQGHKAFVVHVSEVGEIADSLARAKSSDNSSHNDDSIHNTVGINAFAQVLQQSIDIEKGIHLSAGLISHQPETQRADTEHTNNQGSDSEHAINQGSDSESTNRSQTLIIAIHHLVVDVISWSVLLQDLTLLLDTLADEDAHATEQDHSNDAHALENSTRNGADPLLPAKTLSQQDWNDQLAYYADSENVLQHKGYWLDLAAQDNAFPNPELASITQQPGTVSDAHIVRHQVSQALSEQLLHDANNAFTTEPQHLLLSALSLATDAWAGVATRLVNLESHGREPLPFAPQDEHSNALPLQQEPGRTVGWFTVASPFLLNSGEKSTAEVIKDVKERHRRVPGGGRDFGLLRWLSTHISPQEKQQLANVQPQMGFNYLGLLDGNQTVQPLDRSITTSADFEQTLALDWVLYVQDQQLTLELMYDSQRVNNAQANALLQHYNDTLQAVADYCMGQQQSEKTATDFTVTELDQDEFDDILNDIF